MKRILAAALALLMITSAADAVINPLYPTEPTAELWRLYDPGMRYYYLQLTDAEKRLFSARYDCVALGQADLWNYPVGGLTAESRGRIDFVLLYDCPEVMFYPDEAFQPGHIPAPDPEACAGDAASLKDKLAECMTALEEIRNEPEWGDTDFDKELAADRYLVRHCEYDLEADFSVRGGFLPDRTLRTAYGALAAGRANCAGYAQAMTLAMRCFGVPCISTTGIYYQGDGKSNGHQWNLVQIDGEWVHEDATWNDTGEESLIEDFFPFTNRTSNEVYQIIKSNPERYDLDLRNPNSASDRNNYYIRKGQTVGADWRTEVTRRVLEAHGEGRHAIGLRFLDSAAFDEVTDLIDADESWQIDEVAFPHTAVYVWVAEILYIYWE